MGYTVTATSGPPNDEQRLATGLALMTRNVAITVGIPALSTIAATRSAELGRLAPHPGRGRRGDPGRHRPRLVRAAPREQHKPAVADGAAVGAAVSAGADRAQDTADEELAVTTE